MICKIILNNISKIIFMNKNEIYSLINNYHFNINYHANEYCTESARYTDMSDVSASAKFCVVVMERGIIRAFPSD